MCTYNTITSHNLGLLTMEINEDGDHHEKNDSEENASSLSEGHSGVSCGRTAAEASAGYQKSDCGDDSKSNNLNDALTSGIVFETRLQSMLWCSEDRSTWGAEILTPGELSRQQI